MMAFHDDADAFSVHLLFDVTGDLLRKPLLYLEAACETIDKTRQFADAKYLTARNIANVATTVER